jgi:hypothetical protein
LLFVPEHYRADSVQQAIQAAGRRYQRVERSVNYRDSEKKCRQFMVRLLAAARLGEAAALFRRAWRSSEQSRVK